MKHVMAATASRTVGFSRLLLALAVALVLGTMVAPEVEASKPGKNTIASVRDRIAAQRDYCELLGGGELEVRRGNGGKRFTYCDGGQFGGTSCTHTDKATSCQCGTTGKKGLCDSKAITAPPQAGGGGPQPGDIGVDPPDETAPGGEPEQPTLQ